MIEDTAVSRPPDEVIDILLVEDNEGDIFLTKKAFEKANTPSIFHVATDGEIAIQMLRQEEKYRDTPRPSLILLDINLPKMDGKQVLQTIRSDDSLRRIPVVILTSSHVEQDVLHSYDLYANSYVIKPLDLNTFYDVAKAIEMFWFHAAVLPQK